MYFTGVRHVSNIENFEFSEIKHILKCLGALINHKYERSGGGGISKTYESIQGGRGSKNR